MKKSLIKSIACSSILASALLLPSVTRAEEAAHPEKPFLWEVSGNGVSKPSYLFGTIHLGDERVTTLHPAVEKAFSEAEVVVTEVPMDMATQLGVAPKMMRMDGKTLDESIGEELAARVNEELALINPALNSKPFQSLSTWVVVTLIPMLPDQMAGKVALDKVLWDRATEENKKTAALETMDDQLAVFTAMKEEEQVLYLRETLKTLKEGREEGRDMMEELKVAYVSGDLEKLIALMDEGFADVEDEEVQVISAAFKKRLLTDRDVSMAATIDGMLAGNPNGVHFFAAGAAHFASEISIISHMEKAGYTVTRVED
ncbi:MAG: TraB/GumN family protein [Akkermansiaceae bacterium]|jgi:uncharacterized protein|nr:TraB/GumN family protein [Akkermansiaceae bacterium]MDP4645801.1 TraB/GumN family protein [Akkermansiaceae bacterium]MDP4720536.1 TraB/GumN family protein [Akkermansiaceae bacterium]MDP4779026.1 TraB/GumN family protein [Akkermansiaceae bacterium]MDP4847970.1 TraB/GumN family protein [Akkermansiaceae bacterium]